MTSEGDPNVKSRKNQMLNRVYRKLKEEYLNKSNDTSSIPGELNEKSAILRASKLTGLSSRSLLNLEILKEENILKNKLNRLCIQMALSDFILQKQTLPTTLELFEAKEVAENLPVYMDIYSFKKKLIQYDFVWKYIPGYNTFVVMERPCVTYERYSYLKRFLECVDESMPAYFIDELVMDRNKIYNLQDSFKMASDVRRRVIYAASDDDVVLKAVEDFNELEFKLFVVEVLVPALRKPSVIVMDNAKHHCEKLVTTKPSVNSLKDDLRTWLDKHNVPYDTNMSRTELYLLTERCTNRECSIYVIDNVLRAHGHVLLRLPKHIDFPTPTSYLFSMLEFKYNIDDAEFKWPIQERLMNHLISTTPAQLGPQFHRTIKFYRKMFSNDKEIDDVLDDVIANMACKPFSGDVDSDVPDLSDSE